jgi:hypothetical protein
MTVAGLGDQTGNWPGCPGFGTGPRRQDQDRDLPSAGPEVGLRSGTGLRMAQDCLGGAR